MSNTALILIDIQNDYFANGACALEGEQSAVKNAAKLLELFRARQLPIVHIAHEAMSPELGFMLPGSVGQKIHESVAPRAGETMFTKNFPNSFWQTNLEAHLKDCGVKNLVVAGMMTHMCVSSTTRAAMERGFTVTVVGDACATRALEINGEKIPAQTVHKTALAELTMLAQISSLEAFSMP